MNELTIKSKDLPRFMKRMIREEYGKLPRKIAVEAGDEFAPDEARSCFDGNQGVLVIVDLESESYAVHRGNFGGGGEAGMIARRIDIDARKQKIPRNGAVVIGYRGHYMSARIRVRPETLSGMLPPSFNNAPE